MGQEPSACGILAVDIERFSRPEWSDPVRLRLRARLYNLVDRALAHTQITSEQVTRTDTGDGVWLLITSRVPAIRLLNPLIPVLAAFLADDNQRSPATQQLRLRIVAHTGRILTDRYGHTGQALILTARLLDADVGRLVLAAYPKANLVLLLSEELHQCILSRGAAEASLDSYQPVWVSAKETSTCAWVHLPGLVHQPTLTWLPNVPTMAHSRTQDLKDVIKPTENRRARHQTPGEPLVEEGDVRRRELLIYAGTLFGDFTLDRFLVERAVSRYDALVAERVTWRLRGLGETMPPEHVSRALCRHVNALARLAERATKATVRIDLLRVLAQTQAYGGYVAAFDLADQSLATQRFHEAMRAADESSDSVMSGIVCMRMADSALAIGRPRHALEITRAGMPLVQGDPSLQVALSTSMAQAYADLDQATPARAALDRAEQFMDHPEFGRSRWSRMNRERFMGDYGLVAVRLGHLEEASAMLQQAIDWHPTSNAHRAVLTMGLATVRFEQDAPEQAASLVNHAAGVITRLPSVSRHAVFSALAPYFDRYRHVPAVAELTNHLSTSGRVSTQ